MKHFCFKIRKLRISELDPFTQCQIYEMEEKDDQMIKYTVRSSGKDTNVFTVCFQFKINWILTAFLLTFFYSRFVVSDDFLVVFFCC